jgi:hypothetical protein
MFSTQDQHVHRLLEEIEHGNVVSQRYLARNVGIALGLTNLLVKRLIRKGLVRVISIRPNRVTYLITPAGLVEKARMSRDYLSYSIRFYAEAKDRIGRRFQELSNGWNVAGGPHEKRVVFYGAGEVAEVGFVCLQSSDLRLVGVVDVGPRERFFGFDVQPPSAMCRGSVGDVPFDKLVVMSFGDRTDVERQLAEADYSLNDVFWI